MQVNGKRTRTVVISQGKEPTIVVQDGNVSVFPVPLLDPAKIVDTNGAGDSFVGGFFSYLLSGEPLEVGT